MATLYTAQGRVREVQPASGEKWTAAELQSIVGGCTEVLRTVDGEWMIVNEAYKIVYGVAELNYQATRLWINGRRDVILGPALVFDKPGELDTLDGIPRWSGSLAL